MFTFTYSLDMFAIQYSYHQKTLRCNCILGLILYSPNNCIDVREAALHHQEMLWICCRGDTEGSDKHSQI